MTETFLVLLIIVLLIVAGIFVYYSFFSSGLSSLGKERTDVENIILLHVFASMPETKCEKDECVDAVKLIGFKDLINENKAYYSGKFKNKKVIVENTYPEVKEEIKGIECTIDKFQQTSFPDNCGFFVVYDGLNKKTSYSVSLPVSLYFGNLNEYRIGLLRIQGAD